MGGGLRMRGVQQTRAQAAAWCSRCSTITAAGCRALCRCCCAGDVVRAPCGVMHGKTSPVFHKNVGVLEGLDK